MDQYVHVSSGGLDCLILRGAWANVAGAIYYVGFETQCAAYKYYEKNRFISAVKLTTKFQPCKNRCTSSWEIDGNSKCYAAKWVIILVGPKVPEDI